MIDLIVVIQAIAAGLILHRAANEQHAWDRAGFAFLACAAGLMTIRRVTAALDRYADVEQVFLPNVITWAMLAAATCFALELIGRAVRRHHLEPRPAGIAGSAKFVWPFALMLLMSASDFVPVAKPEADVRIHALSAEQAIQEAVSGANTAEVYAAVHRHSARGIDALRIKAGSSDPDAQAARQSLRELSTRINSALQAYDEAEAAQALSPK